MSAPLHRILALLGSEKRLLVLQRLVDGPFTVGEAAKTLDLTQDRASHLIAELVSTGLVQKTRKGQRVEAAVDRDEIMLFLSNLGETIYPGGVTVTPRSVLDLDGGTLTDALIAERIVVYDDLLPEVEPDGTDEAGNPYELDEVDDEPDFSGSIESSEEHIDELIDEALEPDPFIDGWEENDSFMEDGGQGWEDRGDGNVDSDDEEEVIDAT